MIVERKEAGLKTLREIRKERGVTKSAVQKHLGVSQPTYDRYEEHPEKMRLADFEKVCSFLHCERDDIFLPSEESKTFH